MIESAVTATASETELVPSGRADFAFSRNGRHGVCRTVIDDEVVLERWALTSEQPSSQPVRGLAVTPGTNALPLDDGRIVCVHSGETATAAHELVVVAPSGDGDFSVTRLGEISSLLGGFLLASPSSTHLAYFVALDDLDHSTIWALSDSAPQVEAVVRIPGSVSGGVWLDERAGLLAVNQVTHTQRSSGVVVDLADGAWRRIWSMSEHSTDRIVGCRPRSGLLVVSTNVGGEERLGWGRLGDAQLHFPENLHRPGYLRQTLALDERGEQLLVHEVAGAVSRLFTYTLAAQRLTPLAGPPGTISAPASWVGDLVRFRFSAPSEPSTLATVRVAPVPRWSVSRHDEAEQRPGWAEAELVELPGSGGPIEAIVYGGPGWRRCPHLVMALHGGPLSSWRFEFDPLFQGLAAAGVAVVAPNHRGSTGYGLEHLWATIGDWGGPDLDDVLHVGRDLTAERAHLRLPRPVVLGASYGAYLALLAACNSPQLWSACVALAPFLSGPRLHASADPQVRSRIEQLGGLTHRGDTAGPRDVLRACPSLSAPLLLVHGTKDLTIPVQQSRMLARRLTELGRAEGFDFDYVEIDCDHRGVASAQPEALHRRVVHFCLTHPG